MRKVGIGVLFLVCLVTRDSAQSPVRVLSSDGSWTAAGRALRRPDPIAADAALLASQPGDVLLDCGSGGWLSYTCKTGNCQSRACALSGTNVVVEKVQLRRADLLGDVVESLADFLFKRQLRQPIVAAARAGGNPNDAVVVKDSKGIHFGPSLSRVLEGTYCLSLTPLPQGTATSLSIQWDRAVDAEGLVTADRVAPGLYQLEKGSAPPGPSGCTADSDGAAAWVLVADAGQFPRLDTAWRSQLPAIAELEQAGVGRSTVDTVRHGVLAALAEALGRP